MPYAGPIKVDWQGRISFSGAMVMGNQCLLGAIPVEDMDIMVHPARQCVIDITPSLHHFITFFKVAFAKARHTPY